MLALPMTLFGFQNFAFISESLSGEFRSGFHKGSVGPGLPCASAQVTKCGLVWHLPSYHMEH